LGVILCLELWNGYENGIINIALNLYAYKKRRKALFYTAFGNKLSG